MKRLQSIGLLVVVVALLGSVWGVTAHAANALSVPTGAIINSATLWVYAYQAGGDTVRVHRVTAPWAEYGVTWNNFNASYDPAVAGSFVTDAPGWRSADVTQLVKAWATGLSPNYGFLLEQDPNPYKSTDYESSEGATPARYPKLEICYTVPGDPMQCLNIQRPSAMPAGDVMDVYITEASPDYNGGAAPYLFTGLVGSYSKQALIQFSFDFQPSSGCTLTPGYWKTHSKYGPASYDATWGLVQPAGEDSPFFLSGKTYYQALWTAPQGNAYYILAHAYIAAYLNGLDGADTSAVTAQLAHALSLFQTYSPTDTLPKAVRQDFVNTASVLDQYNNGYIGPGHCAE